MEAIGDAVKPAGSPQHNSKKKRKFPKKALVIIGAVAVLAVAASVLLFNTFGKVEADDLIVIQQATVTKGDVSTTIEGTGSLASSGVSGVYVPTGVEIEEVRVSAGDEVAEGDILATVEPISLNVALYSTTERLDELDDEIADASSDTAEYYKLLKEQKDLQEKSAILQSIAQENAIKATKAGTISEVNVSADSDVSASSGSDGSGSADSAGGYSPVAAAPNSAASNTQSGVTGTAFFRVSNAEESGSDSSYLLAAAKDAASGTADKSADSTETPTKQPEAPVEQPSDTTETPADADKQPADTTEQPADTTEQPAEQPKDSEEKAGEQQLKDIIAIDLSASQLAPSVGAKPIKKVTDKLYTGVVTWRPAHTVFKTATPYTAQVVLTPAKGYQWISSLKVTQAGAQEISYVLKEDGTLVVTLVFAPLADDAAKNAPTDDQGTNSEKPSTGSTPSSSGASSGGGSYGAVSSTSSSTGTSSDTDNSELVAAFSIASGENMTLTVSVDELDILSVSKGQSANITLDALEGQVFTGEIARIDKTGTSSGGVTKYSVDVTVAKTEQMLAGMNASVSIVIKESADVLLIPSAALQQEGRRSFVYTAQDESTQELSGATDVELGNSDGSMVEILSGLAEGDTVFYEVISDSSTQNTNGMPSFSGPMSGGGMQGGVMPEGMQPPSGARPEGFSNRSDSANSGGGGNTSGGGAQ